MKKLRKRKNILDIFPFFFMFMIMILATAFASIDNITGTIEVQAESPLQEGVFISDAEYYSNVSADMLNSKINTYSKRMLSTKVVLSTSDASSSITYKVKLYNNTNYIYTFEGIKYDTDFYDNTGIQVEVSNEGTKIGGYIEQKKEVTVYVTFKYTSGQVASSNILNSYINFEIGIPGPTTPILTNSSYQTSALDPVGAIDHAESSIKWQRSTSVSVSSSTYDDRTSISRIEFSYDKLNWSTWSGTLDRVGNSISISATWNSNYNTRLYVRAVDNLGNVSAVSSTYLKVDTSAPTISISASAASTEANISFNISTQDNLSGIQRIEWYYKVSSASSYSGDSETYSTINGTTVGSSSKTKSGTLGLSPSTTYNIFAQVYDVAGNRSQSNVVTCTTPNTIYVTLYTDGTHAFNNVPGTISGKTVRAGTWNITGQKYHPAADSQTANNVPWLGYASSVTSTQVVNTIIPESMGMWFYNCTNLTSVSTTIRTSINTTNVQSIGYMYYGCSSLTTAQLPNLTSSTLAYMPYVFAGCRRLTNIAYDSSTLNTSSVTQMRGMFQSCSSLTSLNFITKFSNTSNVRYFEMMFDGCSGLTTINLSSFNTSNAIWMQAMFRGCSKLTTPTNIKTFKTNNVTNMQEMFSGCSSLKSLNCYNDSDSSCWNTKNVTNMNYMFQNCSNLATINRRAGNWSTKASTTGMFSGCKAKGFTNK